MKRRRTFCAAVLAGTVLAGCLQPAWACPLCGDALSSDPTAGGRAALGYVVSIVALLGVPVLLIAGTAFAVVRRARRHGRVDTASRSR